MEIIQVYSQNCHGKLETADNDVEN